jgi:hypothetical protein
MSKVIANIVVLHGSNAIKTLEQEIRKRFSNDLKRGNNKDSAIPRLLFGLSEEADFAWLERTGAHWAYFQARDGGHLIFISPRSSIPALQDHITTCAAKIDPNVIVQVDYEDIVGSIIGTRITVHSQTDGVIAFNAVDEDYSAFDKELSRGTMAKIRNSQRAALRDEIISRFGNQYAKVNLKVASL